MSIDLRGHHAFSVPQGFTLCRLAVELGIESEEIGALVLGDDDVDENVLVEELEAVRPHIDDADLRRRVDAAIARLGGEGAATG
jgi:3-deoxy-D-manno-octulosonate 8-phosphate phosphatase KdsC-like HAD superfamily phosphatase